LISEYTK
jgi:hypothetical protein